MERRKILGNFAGQFSDNRSESHEFTRMNRDEEKAQAALAELCKIYWRPVFAFICRQGHSVPDAQDLTQEFFSRVIKGRLMQSADRNKGRFRSLLLKALQRFLYDQG